MPTRRQVLTMSVLLLPALAAGRGARAQAPADPLARAKAFVAQAGADLAGVVNGPGSDTQKKAALQRVVDRVIDVEDFARFCLGRFWNTATPQQQQAYTGLFHAVLMNNLSSKISQYAGVSFTEGRAAMQGAQVMVDTVVTWPDYAPYNVRWLVDVAGPTPKVVDVIAQGTSMRLTQRSDYASYLARNNFDVAALITAMRQQVGT